jgi:predicted amidohydrolase
MTKISCTQCDEKWTHASFDCAMYTDRLTHALDYLQAGRNNAKRESYGHAIIIDPWGKVLADAGADASPTIICADIGRSHVYSENGHG